jgi:hypothetical protein
MKIKTGLSGFFCEDGLLALPNKVIVEILVMPMAFLYYKSDHCYRNNLSYHIGRFK